MRMFLEKGFEATTIEEIADAVEISPSTFFNYFPNKEAVVFEDELDPLILAAFNQQPPDTHPIGALRAAMMKVFSNLTPEQDTVMRQRMQLIGAAPELRAAMMGQFADLVDQIAELLATRSGRGPKDFVVHNIAGALLGALLSAMTAAIENPDTDLIELANRSMAHLEAGLPLDWPPRSAR
jgi:AcrR family transcriptional regulator